MSTDFQLPERRYGQSVWNQVDLELALIDGVDRQADAVERDRALFGDEARQFRRHAKAEYPALACRPRGNHPGQAVDMAADQVSAEALAPGQSRLQMDRTANLEAAQAGAAQACARQGGVDAVRVAI